jgi:mannose-6-phosphate isomerase-like protein (cupin superfamily)
MVHVLTAALLAGCISRAEIRDVMKSPEIERRLAVPGAGESAIHQRPNFAILLKRLDGKAEEASKAGYDEILWIRKGRAKVRIGDRAFEAAAGDFLHVERNASRRVDPGAGRVEFISVRIFPSGESLPQRAGFLAPRRMPDLLTKKEIDATIAKYESNQPLQSSNAYTINYVIYKAKEGPWESHRDCVDVYFVQQGEAKAQLGGEILSAKEVSPGEIRGSGVKGPREHGISPGDLVVIPRNGAHKMIPSTDKLAYLLLKVWAE